MATETGPMGAADGPRQLHLIGAGGHASVLVDIARRSGFAAITLWVEEAPRAGRFPPEVVVRDLTTLDPAIPVVLGFGDLDLRAAMRARFPNAPVPLVDPSSTLGYGVRLGAGAVVMARCVVNAHAQVGRDVILNTGAIVEHDCVVGDNVHVSPAACLAGAARIERGVHIGTAAVVLPGILIGEGAVVGAGAVVTREVAPGETVIGIPARPMQDRRR